MNYVKLAYNSRSYDYKGGTSTEVQILGHFLASDVRCSKESSPTYAEWALQDRWGIGFTGNTTRVRKEDNYILLSDLYSEEAIPTKVKMTPHQFVQLIEDWYEKVCKHKPKQVIIKHENDKFTIETSD
jgi:hypothetical protein